MHRTVRLNETREEQLGVSCSGAQDLPQGLAMETFARSDRTRRWTCSVRCGLHEHGRQQEQAPPDMQTGQSIRACLRREVPTDIEPHSQTQRRQLRRVATTELRRGCTPGTRSQSCSSRLPEQEDDVNARAGATKLWKHGPPRTEAGGS